MYFKVIKYTCLLLTLNFQLTKSLTVKELLLDNSKSHDSEKVLIRVPRNLYLQEPILVSNPHELELLENKFVPFVRFPRRSDPYFSQPFKEPPNRNQNGLKKPSSRVRRQTENNKYYSSTSYSGTRDSSTQDRDRNNDKNANESERDREETRRDKNGVPLEKRCISCMSGYLKPYLSDRYDPYGGSKYSGTSGAGSYYDDYSSRPYDRYDRNRYDPYDRYDSGRDKYYDRYDDYDSRDPYYGSYNSGYGSSYDRSRGRYGGSGTSTGYGSSSTGYGTSRDRYDPYYERGLGYDNRGYDFRDFRYDAYRPYDDNYRSYSNGYDSIARGYNSRPDYSTYGYASNVGGYESRGGGYGGGSGGYARDYGYGRRNGYDRDRYGGSLSYSGGGYGGGGSRYRDPYYDSPNRFTTNYLYDRTASSTTESPQKDDSITPNSSQDGSG